MPSRNGSYVPAEHSGMLKRFIRALLLVFALLAGATLCLWLMPHEKLKALLGSLVAAKNANGSVTHPTEHGLDALVGRLPLAITLFAACAAALAGWGRKLERWLLTMPTEWREARGSLRDLFPRSVDTWWEVSAVLVLSGIGLFLRLWHIRRAIRYDEASTYLLFASQPIYRALSNYSYPNNHLLHTLLAYLSIQVFGDTAVTLRLPALLGGCLCIPASWVAARALYGRLAGILSAGCVAALPTFVEFSVNARGYSLQWLCILCMMTCAVVLSANLSSRPGWLGFVISGVAGLYCIPTMIIPAAGMVIWMLMSGAASRGTARLRELLRALAWAVVGMGLVSALLYLPPLLASGPSALVSNRFVASRETSFLDGLGPLLHSTWQYWTEGVPAPVTWILVAGAVLGLLFHRRASKGPLPLPLVLWGWSLVFAWARNILGYPRVWSFLLLAGIMTASAGIALLIDLISAQPRTKILVAGGLAVLMCVIVGASLLQHRVLFKTNETVALVDSAQVVQFLETELRPGDSLVVTFPANPIIEYELLHQDRRLYRSLAPLESAEEVIAVVSKPDVASESYRADELLARLAEEDTADPSLASAELHLADYNPPRLLRKFLSATVYSFERRTAAGRNKVSD